MVMRVPLVAMMWIVVAVTIIGVRVVKKEWVRVRIQIRVITWFRIGLPVGRRFHCSILTFDLPGEIVKRLHCLILVHRYFA
jgi:hypothetical protein